jgi:hypothetical protein
LGDTLVAILPGFPRAGTFSQRMPLIRSALLPFISLYRSEFFDGGELEFSYGEHLLQPGQLLDQLLDLFAELLDPVSLARYDVLRSA